jgi:hypothetical protein
MYFKFDNKKAALDFCIEVNRGENISVSENNVTTGYAQPFELSGQFYVIADEVTSKYTDLEPIDLFAPKDYTPPTLSTLRVAIPKEWENLFPDDKFIINGFEVQLERVNGILAVDIAYIQWSPFQEELDRPENAAVKRHMMPIWDYVAQQAQQNNFI